MEGTYLLSLIGQLKQYCAPLGGRVFGSEGWSIEYSSKTTNPVYPAAYVVKVEDVAEANEGMTEYLQKVKQEYDVFLILVSAKPSSSINPKIGAEMERLVKEVHKSILFWTPDPKNYGRLEFAGGGVEHVDGARMVYRLDYKTTYLLGFEDSWQKREQDGLPPFSETTLEMDFGDGAPATNATFNLNSEE